MNSREIVTKAAQHLETPRTPVSLLSGGAWTFNRQGLSLKEALGIGAQRAADIIASTNEQVGSDIVWAGSGYHNLALQAIGAKIKFRATGVPDIQEPLLQKASDVDGIDLGRLQKDDQINVLWETGHLLAADIGATTMVGASSWGPFTLAGLAYGADKLLRNIYYDTEAVHKILDFSAELCYQYLEPYIKGGAGIISIADPSASGNLISRKHFQEFTLPYLQKVIQRVRAHGVLTLVHICGNISNRLDLITKIGADIISVDYKVDLGYTRATVGSVMAFAGNMDPVTVMLDLKPDGVTRACEECINRAGKASGYILMPGCNIPPSVPLENIQAMVAVAHNFEKEVD